MKMSHEDYLKSVLKTNKLTLELMRVNHQIAIAEYNARTDIIIKQNDSIERQLGNK